MALVARLSWMQFGGHDRLARVEDLFIAARLGSAKEVRKGLDFGIDPNSTEPEWPPRIHSYWQDLEQFLGLSRPKPAPKGQPLIEAAVSNAHHPEVAKLLLDRGATPTFESVCIASNLGSEGTLELLLSHGAPFETAKATAMTETLQSGRPRAVKILLDRGARIPADWENLTRWCDFRGGDRKGVRKLIKGILAKEPSRLR